MKQKEQTKNNISRFFWIKTILLLLPFVYFIILNIVQPSGLIKYTWHFGIWLPLTTYVVMWEGKKYLNIYKQIFKGILNMDTLIGLGAHILYVYSIISMSLNISSPMYSYQVMWEGPVVLILVTNIGHKLEEVIQSSALETYDRLEEMRTSNVNVYRNEEMVVVPINEINKGEVIYVEAGGFVPLDGILLSSSTFDYSNITGESKNINIKKGDTVVSGAYNISGGLKIKVNKTSESSTISHIIDTIEEVSTTRPKMQVLADKVLKVFVPLILSISFITFCVWLIIGYTIGIKVPWIHNDNTISVSLSAAVTVIAIACPCALGIATPLIYTVSSMLASDNGIIVNEPKVLETINDIKIIAFDKTGTLTTKKMEIKKIHGKEEFIGIARALEEGISHPIAQTILDIKTPLLKVKNIKQEQNSVSGKWKEKNVVIKRYEGTNFNVSKYSTNIGLYISEIPVLVFEIVNTIKKDVKKIITKLKNKNIKVVMITGDEKNISEHIAKTIGIEKVYSNVKPDGKAKIIGELQKEGQVMFVGDGFNDAVAVKKAHVSSSFANGSDITNSLSDLTIASDSFGSILKIFTLARINKRSVKIALIYAMLFNLLTIPIAMILLVQPWLGATIMAISDILVSLNAYVYKYLGKKKLRD